MDPTMLITLINGILAIIERHRASGNTTPLTDVEVRDALVQELTDGQSAIAQEFAAKGWPLPA